MTETVKRDRKHPFSSEGLETSTMMNLAIIRNCSEWLDEMLRKGLLDVENHDRLQARVLREWDNWIAVRDPHAKAVRAYMERDEGEMPAPLPDDLDD